MSTTAQNLAPPPVQNPAYFSTAVYSQYNLILLGGSVLFSLASASPMPLLIGTIAEFVWLSTGPRLPVFRRHVDRRLDSERRAQQDDDMMVGLRTLAPEANARVLAFNQNASWVALGAETAGASDEAREALVELEQLRFGFMKLCRVDERLVQRLEELRLAPPELEIAHLSQAYAAEKDIGARLSLHQAIKAAQRQTEQQAHWIETKRQVDAKLSLLEQGLLQLRQQQEAGTLTDLAREVQSLSAHTATADALEAELSVN